MSILIDYELLQQVIQNCQTNHISILPQLRQQNDINLNESRFVLTPSWETLFKYLEIDTLFENFLKFDTEHTLFVGMLAALSMEIDKEVLLCLYDQLFTECLTQVKNLPEINQPFLLEKIREKKVAISRPFETVSLPILIHFENYLVQSPHVAMHDLILYCAWDRLCVCLASLFEYPVNNAHIHKNIGILIEALVESFHHITLQKKTKPGFFRLVEVLYAYTMREEFLQTYTEEEWQILSENVRGLSSRAKLTDIFYLDHFISDKQIERKKDKRLIKVMTHESLQVIQARVSLAKLFNKKIETFFSNWSFEFESSEIITVSIQGELIIIDNIFNPFK